MNAPAADSVLCIAVLCIMISSPFVRGQDPVSSFSIEESKFSCAGSGRNLRCSRNATTTVDGLLKLTPDPPGRQENSTYFVYTFGVALYKNPVQVMNRSSNQVASLNISFSFQIEGTHENGPGDGLAFVMFADGSWVGVEGNKFGAFDKNGVAGVQTLAVEFDTYKNPEILDQDANHVGFDINSVTSEMVKKAEFPLAAGDRTYVWIEYHPESLLLELRASEIAERPAEAMISYSRNLMDVFDVDNVWVGFSAANGLPFFSYHTVHNLNFQSSFLSSLESKTGLDSKTQKSKPLNSGTIAGITVGVAGILVGVCSLLSCVRSFRKLQVDTMLLPLTDASSSSGATGVASEFQMARVSVEKFSYDQLSAATETFSEALKLGEGGFGSVYLGSIPAEGSNSSLLVAVKKVSSESRQGEREFIAEVSTIGMLRHRNLVQLLSWCSESRGNNYLLVCEYFPNGSLDRHLYPRAINQKPEKQYFLRWNERIKILRGIAAALHFLHEGWRQQVIHRDVKSSNVMLDDDLNAMLGDFGLARMSDHFKNPVTTCVAGTYGYIAPEAAMTGKYTVKSDVFSFGAVCLEVVCGRRVYDETNPVDDETLLVDLVWRKLSEDEVLSVVDRRLGGEFKVEEVKMVLLLGLLCSHPKPGERPTMHNVLEILAGRMELPTIPRTKPEGDHYAYPYQNKEKKLLLSDTVVGEESVPMRTGFD